MRNVHVQDNVTTLDENQTMFFSRELEFVKTRTYDIEYPQLKATLLIPVSTEAGTAAEFITYQQFDSVGIAKIIADYAKDLPRVDVFGKEFTSPVRSIGESFGYSVQEIRAAQSAGKPLQQRKASAARKANDQKVDTIAWFGDTKSGLPGFLTNPNVTRYVVPQGAGGNTTFKQKTPDEVIFDLNEIANGIVVLTQEVEAPDTLLLPIDQYTYISSTPRSANSDTTILQYFLNNNQYINRVEPLNKLSGQGTLGTGDSTDIMVAYPQDPDVLTLEIPQSFEMFPAQQNGLEFEINCHSRCGGVIIYKPLAIAIAEGI